MFKVFVEENTPMGYTVNRSFHEDGISAEHVVDHLREKIKGSVIYKALNKKVKVTVTDLRHGTEPKIDTFMV